MEYFNRLLFGISLFFVLFLLSECRMNPRQLEEYYCSIQAGEPSQTTVILQGRLHKTDTLQDNDIQGIEGYIKFCITRDIDSKSYMESHFLQVSDSNDFIARYRFTGLRPGQKYFYKILYGRDSLNVTYSLWANFKTLNPSTSDKSISFSVFSGMNYHAFRTGNFNSNTQIEDIDGLKSGFPVFHSISVLNPDFFIANGNNVYYDEPKEFPANTRDEMRVQWHWLYSMPRFKILLSQVPGYWMINDHDFHYEKPEELPVDLPGGIVQPETMKGSEVFFEQVPVFVGGEEKTPFRTLRLNKDVQIWMLEGRLFRSQLTQSEIGSNSIWGIKQVDWLKNTLKESDAAFKLIISPAALIGPDEIFAADNHTNHKGFRAERDSLFLWLKNNGFRNNGLYFICGDVQWQYHSVDPSGFEEFSCGTAIDANYRTGLLPGDSLSTDPFGLIVQPYIQKEAKGGFLLVSSGRDEYSNPVLLFRFYDEQKKLLYAVNKY
jgi:alkaline phosphatase/alkaline phosphatase D